MWTGRLAVLPVLSSTRGPLDPDKTPGRCRGAPETLFISLPPPGCLVSLEGQATDAYLERKTGQVSRGEGHTEGGKGEEMKDILDTPVLSEMRAEPPKPPGHQRTPKVSRSSSRSESLKATPATSATS